MEAVIRPDDRVCLEGDNQKQADLLSAALIAVEPAKVNGPHMVQSGVVLPEHLDLFERGVAKKLDYAYSGPQSARIATMLFGGKISRTALGHGRHAGSWSGRLQAAGRAERRRCCGAWQADRSLYQGLGGDGFC